MKPHISKLRDRMPWMWLRWQCVSGGGWNEVKGFGGTPAEAFQSWGRRRDALGPLLAKVDRMSCRCGK